MVIILEVPDKDVKFFWNPGLPTWSLG